MKKPHIHLPERYLPILTLVKYCFPILLSLRVLMARLPGEFLFCLLESLLLMVLSDLLLKKSPRFLILIDALYLLLNLQIILRTAASTYLNMILITNLDMVQDLSGKAAVYLFRAALLLAATLLPAVPLERLSLPAGRALSAQFPRLLSALLAVELVAALSIGNTCSPLYAYARLAGEYQRYRELKSSLKGMENEDQAFYKPEIVDSRPRPADLPQRPNVILLLSEGVSQHIIDDERGLMPNMAEYQKNSLNVTNYYNHTFATFRGIIGQLYSGYQMDNYDSNRLVSLQKLFSDQGYTTCMINTEPISLPFTKFLGNMGFDRVAGTEKDMEEFSYITDRLAYELLYDQAMEMNQSGQPFFTVMYSFGTHASLDSPDEVWGDGSDSELNKFYNLDYQYGQFMERLASSPLAENTIVITTADHATYVDEYYLASFPDQNREVASLDTIPLFLYYKGITPEELDAGGRNTLDLAPTICDYLDISGENYFLGLSLFNLQENAKIYDRIFYDTHLTYTTMDGSISALDENSYDSFVHDVSRYFAVARR